MTLEPTYPPSVIQPRQTDRWLDVQPQGGSLSKTHGYIQVPAFSVAHTWKGYSDIVAAFNFTATNNFSFRSGGSIIPVAPNHTLCVMWKDGNNVTYRYSLYRAATDVIYFDLPAYTGQLIKKNFRIEVWSTNSTPAISAAAATVYTTVLGSQDYRFGADFSLGAGTLVTAFSDSFAIPALPNSVNSLMLQHFDAQLGFAAPNWQSQNDVTMLVGANATQEYVNSLYHIVKDGFETMVSGTNGNQNYVFSAVWVDGSIGNVFTYDGRPTVYVHGNNIDISSGVDTAPLVGLNRLYFVYCITGTATIVEDVLTGAHVIVPNTAAAPAASANMTAFDNFNTNGLAELVSYFNMAIPDFQVVYEYFRRKYGGFTLSLTFPANSTPSTN